MSQVRRVEPRTPDGCEECLQAGDRWVHLLKASTDAAIAGERAR